MAEPDKAWTITTKDKMVAVMEEKLWLSFGTNTAFTTWQTWANTSGNAQQKQAATDYDGRTMDFIVSTKWLKDWPVDGTTIMNFVGKWSGGCFEDYSSKVGGFCLLENNGTYFWDCGDIDSAEAAPPRAGTPIIICGSGGTV